jgi:carbamoyl-phosphate synthase large subunit
MKDLIILRTACNGLVSPSQIKSLRAVDERDIRIIGTDANELGAGAELVDDFFVVPMAGEPEFVDQIMTICEENNVDAVIPASDEEVLRLSSEKEKFEKIGTKLVANDQTVVDKAGDKGKFLQFLSDKNLPCAEFRLPSTITEFRSAVHELGYPEHPVVMKPRLARGNRGMRIIQSDINKGDLLLNKKSGHPYATLDDIVEALNSPELDSFPEIVAMEFLPGEEYSVDILAENGTPVITVPKKRVETAPGLSVIGEVDLNETIIEQVKNISNEFGFDYNINIQLRESRNGHFYPYEINPRIAASIDAARRAGANLLYFGIKLALEENVPDVDITDGLQMIRYYEEYYSISGDS